ncbi:MAG: hypothetical protein COB59_12095 [Rhodospirillaceae bacterium]|nr:MAG: hypothetical protein COB59_12095 [Rhodospirillaceae bacterium]
MDADLYFLFTKLAQQFLSPNFVFITALFSGFALLFTKWAKLGKLSLGIALLFYVAFAVLPTGSILINTLEDRFAIPDLTGKKIDGIIVLGGSTNTMLSQARGQVVLQGNAERLTEFVKLARLYPEATLVFTGGIGLLSGKGPTEAKITHQFFSEIGLDVGRVIFEDQARNTVESAHNTYTLLNPKNQNWLLLTSARHMPRAMGLFQGAGWTIVAYPVDYVTPPREKTIFTLSWPGKLSMFSGAIYEFAGLAVSWLRGDSENLFPAPQP